MSNVTIHPNPACGTSRNTLEIIRSSGVEPTIICYLETPPARGERVKLIANMEIPVRALLRQYIKPWLAGQKAWCGVRLSDMEQ